MPNFMLDLIVDRVDLVDEGANSEAFIKLYKRKENVEPMELEEILAKMKPEHADVIRSEIAKAKEMMPEDKQSEMEAMNGELEKAKTDFQAAFDENEVLKRKLQEVETTIAKNKGDDLEEVLKNADPAVQEVFKSMRAKIDAAEAAARQAMENQQREEAIAKARELSNLPVEEDKLVEVMKGISPAVHEILKAANTAIGEAGIFTEVGKSRGGEATSTGGAAWSKIEKKADEVITRDKVSKAKAIATVIKENPELYREYLAGGAN